jgi:integrase/recombinase XerC
MFTDFGAYLTGQDRSPETVRSYLSDLKQFSLWFEQANRGKELTLQNTTALDLRDYRQYLLNTQHRKANTINRKLASLSAWLEWGIQIKVLAHNPAQEVNGVEKVTLAPKWLTKADEAALLRLVERDWQNAQRLTEAAKRQALRNWALVVLMLNTGLRADEVCGLETVDLSISDRKGELIVRQGKGCKERHLPLNKQARQAVQDWLDVRPEVAEKWVFLGQRSDQLSTSALRRIIGDLTYRAEIDPDTSPHTLRHTFAKRLVDAGISLEKVAALLGHSNLNTTRMYLTPGQQDLEEAVRVLEY